MAYRWMTDTTETIRQSPVRVALALILLITTTVYVCLQSDGYGVAEVGDTSSFDEAVDLISSDDPEFVQVSAGEEDSPAQTVQDEGREKYIDAKLTHAFVEESEDAASSRIRVTPVSQEVATKTSEGNPVWLLGTLIED